MASFFGEIRPLFSRAVDDEEVDTQPKYKVFAETFDGKPNCSCKLIVSVAEIASVFVKSYFLRDDSKLIFSIQYSRETDENDDSMFYTGAQNAKSAKNITAVSIFSSSPNVLVCDISKSIPEEIYSDITELMFNNFVFSEVVILTAKHMASYRGENPVHFKMPFLRSLGTTFYTDSCNIPRLNPPNFLTSMGASLLLWCEISKLPAVCFINYVDTDAIDYLNVHVFDEILTEDILSKVPVNADAKAKVIKFVKAKQSNESNLYI